MTVYLNEIKMRMINVTKKSILILWVIVYFVVYITQLLFTQNYAQREAHHTEKSIPSQVNEQQVSEVSIIALTLNNIFRNTIFNYIFSITNLDIRVSFFSPQELEVSNTFKNDIETRNVVLKEACKHYGLDVLGNDRLHKPYPWEYLIAKQKSANLVWCNVFKSGSTRYAGLMYIFTMYMFTSNIIQGYPQENFNFCYSVFYFFSAGCIYSIEWRVIQYLTSNTQKRPKLL